MIDDWLEGFGTRAELVRYAIGDTCVLSRMFKSTRDSFGQYWQRCTLHTSELPTDTHLFLIRTPRVGEDQKFIVKQRECEKGNGGIKCMQGHGSIKVYRGHIDRIDGISQATHFARSIQRWQTSVMSRRRCLGMMIDTCLDVYVQTRKDRAGSPVDTIVEILSPANAWLL
ncbi:hypothetical protein ACTXT7_010315 [Hymenolepis weldensis]